VFSRHSRTRVSRTTRCGAAQQADIALRDGVAGDLEPIRQDRTLEIARRHGVQTFSSLPGRGKGICVGAAAPCGEVLFFLHADSTLLPGALDRISEVLSTDPHIIGGNFRLAFDGDTPFSRWLTGFYARIRSIGLYYGDSGIFVRRPVYEVLGGFRPIPVKRRFRPPSLSGRCGFIKGPSREPVATRRMRRRRSLHRCS
jgi:hypothetical protein